MATGKQTTQLSSVISEYRGKAEETGACYSYHMAAKGVLEVPLFLCVCVRASTSG